MRYDATLPASYFDDIFAADDDPWGLATSAYEAAKFDTTLAALSGRRFASGLEIGCATGVLTARLSLSCDRLLAIDISARAIARARERCAGDRHVAFEQMAFPDEAPSAADFDLMVLSEVVYYWDDRGIDHAAAQAKRMIAPGGDMLLVHWLGDTDYPQSGDQAATKLLAALGNHVEVVRADRTKDYRLDLWRFR